MKKIAIFLLLTTTVFAQKVSLNDAIMLAMKNSKELRVSKKEARKTELSSDLAIAKALPVISYNGNFNKGHRQSGTFNQNITITQPIFTGGIIAGGIAYAKEIKNSANLILMQDKINVRLETIQIYSNIVKNQKNILVLESMKKDLETKYNKQKRELKMRLITKSELLKTEYNILNLNSELIGLKNNVKIELHRLSIKTQTKDIEVIPFRVEQNLSHTINFDKDLKMAQEKSLIALLSKSQQKQAHAQTVINRAGIMPNVSAFATYGRHKSSPSFKESARDRNWSGGIQVSWNIFDFGQDYNTYRRADANEKQQDLKASITRDNIKINVTNAYLELIRIENQRVAQKKAVEVAKTNYKLDSKKYDAGLISTVDYLISETNLKDAETKYNNITMDYLYTYEKYRSLIM